MCPLIARWQKTASGLAGAETGSVTFVQRFNATLGSFVHFHVVALDGTVTSAEDGAVAFYPGRAPSREEIAEVARRVAARMHRWLRRRGLVDERPLEERSNEAPELSPLEACSCRFLARISALVPPPRFPLVRFAGVFAPSSSWRREVVAIRVLPAAAAEPTATKTAHKTRKKTPSVAPCASKTPATSLGAGIVGAPFARIDWASLLRRVYLEDVLVCPCGGRRRIVADVSDPDVLCAILTPLGLPTTARPVRSARDPTLDLG